MSSSGSVTLDRRIHSGSTKALAIRQAWHLLDRTNGYYEFTRTLSRNGDSTVKHLYQTDRQRRRDIPATETPGGALEEKDAYLARVAGDQHRS